MKIITAIITIILLITTLSVFSEESLTPEPSLYERMVAYYEYLTGLRWPEDDWFNAPWTLRDDGYGNISISGEGAPNSIDEFIDFPVSVRVPQEVTRRQFRIALVLAGIDLDDVEVVLNGIEDPVERAIALIEWRDALTFKRNHQLIISFAPLFNLTSEDLDNLFINAAGFQ